MSLSLIVRLFAQMTKILAQRTPASARGPKLVLDSLFKGMLTDSHGRRMGPTHTRRIGQRYRYYTTQPKVVRPGGPAPLCFSAEQLERHCCSALAEHLRSAAAPVIEAVVEAILEASAGLERLQIFEQHVSSAIAGEGMLILVLRSGHRIERVVSMVCHGNDARLLTEEPDQERPLPTPQLVKLMRDAHGPASLRSRSPPCRWTGWR